LQKRSLLYNRGQQIVSFEYLVLAKFQMSTCTVGESTFFLQFPSPKKKCISQLYMKKKAEIVSNTNWYRKKFDVTF
jgi:hypothetical protein